MKHFLCAFLLIAVFVSNSQSQILRPLKKELKAVLNDKSLAKDKAWPFYNDPEMNHVIGRLSPFDTVVVSGWSTWTFYVKNKNVKGYISWLSLQSNPEIDLISSMIKTQSEEDDKLEWEDKEKKDTINAEPHAYLSLTTSKKEVLAGECFTLSLDFHIYDDNLVRMRFHNLGEQIANLIAPKIFFNNCWGSKNYITDVEASRVIDKVTSYKVVQTNLCPEDAGVINFRSLDLNMEKRTKRGAFQRLINFKSNELQVKVKPIVNLKPTRFESFSLVGNFTLTDSISQVRIETSLPVDYFLTIKGEGLTYPINTPHITIPNVNVALVDIIDYDSIIQEKYFSSKTFQFKLIFTKPGKYSLKDQINFSYLNPKDSKLYSIGSTINSLEVVESKFPRPIKSTYSVAGNFIIVDVSQSMQLEDYLPNRLGCIKSGLKAFLSQRQSSNINLIKFAGYPKFVNILKDSFQYNLKVIDSLNFMTSQRARGTAIGEAILFANNFTESAREKKFVVIGDGDNTISKVLPELAAKIAKKRNIKIYSIGVGNRGLVPFGKDYFGRPQMVDNTFSDITLKQIATITGGEYFWAKDAEDITRILKKIFP